jgi:hypothetical protein
MKTQREIPVLKKFKVKNERKDPAASSCCTPKDNVSVCCAPAENPQEGGACCAQPADGSACCDK